MSAARVVGLTGSIGAGKSVATRLVRQLGWAVFDADSVVAVAMDKGGEAVVPIIKRFPSIANEDAGINRHALAHLARGDDAVFHVLESILHPIVFDAARLAISRSSGRLVLDIPLLFETGAEQLCDLTIVVHAHRSIRRARVSRRPAMTVGLLEAIERRQTPSAIKKRLGDRIIRSGLDLRAMRSALRGALAARRSRQRFLSARHRRALGDHAMRATPFL